MTTAGPASMVLPSGTLAVVGVIPLLFFLRHLSR